MLNIVHAPARGERRPHPLLFVHGAWHGAWCWSAFLEWFSERGWDCHAVDFRGHGDSPSDRSLRRTRIKHYTADIAEAVAALPDPPIIVAHSMGSLAAQRFLEGKWLPGAVLLNPVPLGGVWRATFRVARRHPGKFLKANATLRLGPLIEDPAIAAELLLPDEISDGDRVAACDRLQDESYLAYLDMLFFVRARPPLVPTPVAIVAGDSDAIFSVEEHKRLAGAYGTEPRIITGIAHDTMFGDRWEDSARAIAEAIESF